MRYPRKTRTPADICRLCCPQRDSHTGPMRSCPSMEDLFSDQYAYSGSHMLQAGTERPYGARSEIQDLLQYSL